MAISFFVYTFLIYAHFFGNCVMEENKGWMHSQRVVWAKMPEIISSCQQELQSNGGHLSYQLFKGTPCIWLSARGLMLHLFL